MNKRIKYVIISLIVCTLCIPTALNATGNSLFSQENRTINERWSRPDHQLYWNYGMKTRFMTYHIIQLVKWWHTYVRTVQPSYEISLRYARWPLIENLPRTHFCAEYHLLLSSFSPSLEESKSNYSAGVVRHYIANMPISSRWVTVKQGETSLRPLDWSYQRTDSRNLARISTMLTKAILLHYNIPGLLNKKPLSQNV
jgi:hypothetical protein